MKKKAFFPSLSPMNNRMTFSMNQRRIASSIHSSRLLNSHQKRSARDLSGNRVPMESELPHQGDLPADGFLPVDLSAASHSAVIVDVRVEFPDLKNTSEYGLVISRGQCEGNSPHVAALYREAKELVKRLNAKMGRNAEMVARVLANVAGQPVAILG